MVEFKAKMLLSHPSFTWRAGLTPRVSDSVVLGKGQEVASQTHSEMMLMLLVQEPRFENQMPLRLHFEATPQSQDAQHYG